LRSDFSSFLCIAVATCLLAACATPDIPGNYEGTLEVGRDSERHVRVKLQPDGRAAVSTARWGSFSFAAEGGWKRANDGLLVIELTGTSPQRIAFQHGGDLLVAKQWDHALWGDRGPGVLYRVR
jgi:hypothetical protein